jgi:hypothetical protein
MTHFFWKLILANVTEAEFIKATIRQLVQSIHHVVVAAFKRSVSSGRIYDR